MAWQQRATDHPLPSMRESDNPFDARPVRIGWGNRTLGNRPRPENAAVARIPDRGEQLRARVAELLVLRDPWARV